MSKPRLTVSTSLRSAARAPLRLVLRARLLRHAQAFLLGLMLVCAQQAALRHALEHDVQRAGASTPAARVAGGADAAMAYQGGHGGGASDAGAYCDKCFQFAHLAGANLAAAPAELAFTSTTEAARSRNIAEHAVQAPPSRSRGPPSIL
jgi:hypothetical protein